MKSAIRNREKKMYILLQWSYLVIELHLNTQLYSAAICTERLQLPEDGCGLWPKRVAASKLYIVQFVGSKSVDIRRLHGGCIMSAWHSVPNFPINCRQSAAQPIGRPIVRSFPAPCTAAVCLSLIPLAHPRSSSLHLKPLNIILYKTDLGY
jgi:hypothetical protein